MPYLQTIVQVVQDNRAVAWSLHRDSATLDLLKSTQFDLLLWDTTNWPAYILQHDLNIPNVELIPLPLLMPLLSQSQSVPNPMAYLPQLGSSNMPAMVQGCYLVVSMR